MTRPGSSAILFFAMLVAGGCAATSGDDTGSNEDSVKLGHPPDAGTDASADAGAADSDASADAGVIDSDAAADAAPSGPPGPSGSTFGAKLQAIGLDITNLPALHDLPLGQKMKVMKTFNESMGVTCTNCHDASDYAKPTPQKAIASDGWEVISRKLTTADGAPVYCDSCHYGTFDFLDRSGGYDGIATWMYENFVSKLKTKSGDQMTCTTCHVNGPPENTGSTH